MFNKSSKSSNSPAVRLQEGMRQARLKNYEGAISIFTELLQTGRADAQVEFYHRGRAGMNAQ